MKCNPNDLEIGKEYHIVLDFDNGTMDFNGKLVFKAANIMSFASPDKSCILTIPINQEVDMYEKR